jgi:hypothetical protein
MSFARKFLFHALIISMGLSTSVSADVESEHASAQEVVRT